MDTFQFELVSPDSLVRDVQACTVLVPGVNGDFAVLPNHAPMMSTMRPGLLEIYETEGGNADRLFLKGGLVQVTPTGLTILTEEALSLSDVDMDKLTADINEVKLDIEEATDEVSLKMLEDKLSSLMALQEALVA